MFHNEKNPEWISDRLEGYCLLERKYFVLTTWERILAGSKCSGICRKEEWKKNRKEGEWKERRKEVQFKFKYVVKWTWTNCFLKHVFLYINENNTYYQYYWESGFMAYWRFSYTDYVIKSSYYFYCHCYHHCISLCNNENHFVFTQHSQLLFW